MRKAAKLISARPDVPGFGDQLHAAENRVLSDRGQEGRGLVEPVRPPRQCRGQVEAEAVDMHHLDPVAQGVHHHPQHHRMVQVQGVAAAGVVHIEATIRREAVVGGVIKATKAKRRPQFVALGGVVVDDIQDHLDPGCVQAGDGVLEFGDLACRKIARVRGKEADRLVTPVIRQLFLHQKAVVDEGLHWQKLDRGHAKAVQMVQHRVGREAKEAAGMCDARHLHGEPLHMRLIDDAARQGGHGGAVVAPGKGRVGHDAFGHEARAVAGVQAKVGIARRGGIGVKRVRPTRVPGQLPGVGVDQQLVRVEAVAFMRGEGTVRAQTVKLAGHQAGNAAMPDAPGAFRQRHARNLALPVRAKKADVDLRRMVGKDGEIYPVSIKGRAQRAGASGLHSQVGARRRRGGASGQIRGQ